MVTVLLLHSSRLLTVSHQDCCLETLSVVGYISLTTILILLFSWSNTFKSSYLLEMGWGVEGDDVFYDLILEPLYCSI